MNNFQKSILRITKMHYSNYRTIHSWEASKVSDLFSLLKESIQGKNTRIVFPEGKDIRVLKAAVRLKVENIINPVVIGDKEELEKIASDANFSLTNLEIINPNTYEKFDEMVASFVERRKGKVTLEDAHKILKDVNYFGTMLVYLEMADGLVSGAIHSTGDTVRPALQIIKTRPGVSRTSGVFIMARNDDRYVFADCAINISPNSTDLAEIAIESAKTAEMFGIEPRVAMLSFSTKGSAHSPETTKVEEATAIAQEMAPNLVIDGELQFDAAIVPSVAKQKAPNSKIKGDATVFVFPTLEAGNIGYKIAQRLGGFDAVGPILQGLNKPVNDLSRGCSEEDVYKLAIITAAQAGF
jgi:phosphate acetyltransferase